MTTRPYHHQSIPAEILALSHERDLLRRRGQYARADLLKQQIEDAGYVVKDNPHGAHLIMLPSIEVDGYVYRTARMLPSLLDEADRCAFSVNLVARNTLEETQRCIESVLRHSGSTSIEIILVDNASQDGTDLWAEAFRHEEPRLRVLRATRQIGEAEARNVGLKQSLGHTLLLLDTRVEVEGDIFLPLSTTLDEHPTAITGPRGLHTEDLRHFEESQQFEVEAIDGLCMAFRRTLLKRVDLFDEQYRYPYYMDVDFNFTAREKGARAVVTPLLPITCHPAASATIAETERARLTKRNFYRFLEKWGDRDDLLIDG